MIIVLP